MLSKSWMKLPSILLASSLFPSRARLRGGINLTSVFISAVLILAIPQKSDARDYFSSHHDINPSVYESFEGNLIGTLPRRFMRVGNAFELNFSIRVNEEFWEQGSSSHRILTLASNRYVFVEGGSETLDVSIGSEGLTLMTHYRGFTRVLKSDNWEALKKDMSAWQSVRIATNGLSGLSFYINNQLVAKLIDSSDPGWSGNPGYSAPWSYHNSGTVHHIWAPVPGAEGANVTLAKLAISGKDRQYRR